MSEGRQQTSNLIDIINMILLLYFKISQAIMLAASILGFRLQQIAKNFINLRNKMITNLTLGNALLLRKALNLLKYNKFAKSLSEVRFPKSRLEQLALLDTHFCTAQMPYIREMMGRAAFNIRETYNRGIYL